MSVFLCVEGISTSPAQPLDLRLLVRVRLLSSSISSEMSTSYYGGVEEFIHASLSETEEGFVSSAKKSAMANQRAGSELMWKETEKRIGEDWSPSRTEAISSEVDHFYIRKISFYFNVPYEIKDKTIEFDENCNVQRAEFVVRAYMQGGRFSDGWGSCERHEKRLIKPNHDIPSTAETRAKNKACQDLLGIGEYRPGVSQC
ncbi:hypothetical protein Q3G72_020391 [Acer saccharum]|nr:hypothetical protein Q3G72_020391 [Acer saccharum]